MSTLSSCSERSTLFSMIRDIFLSRVGFLQEPHLKGSLFSAYAMIAATASPYGTSTRAPEDKGECVGE